MYYNSRYKFLTNRIMKKTFYFLFTLLLLSVHIHAQDIYASQYQAAMVASERAFAAATEILGIRDGFLSFFSPDAVSFDAELQNAYDGLKNRKPTTYPLTGKLQWAPQSGDIAKSGDFGYLYGSWKYEVTGAKDKKPSYGEYISIWKRDALGLWKVAFDCGIKLPDSEIALAKISFTSQGDSIELRNRKVNDSGLSGKKLIETEAVFAKQDDELQLLLSDNITVFRDGIFPVHSKEDAKNLYAMYKLDTFRNTGISVSITGDMGYTYGNYNMQSGKLPNNDKDPEYQYLHIWKLDSRGNWKLIVDVSAKKID